MLVRFWSLAVLGAAALGAACSGASSSADPDSGEAAGQTAVAPAAAELDPAVSAAQIPAGSDLTGEQVVEYVCSQCHSMDPPPLKAPPLTMLAQHLRETFASVDEAVDHVVTYVPAPDPERSILPEMAQERFGLMPPQPLPEPMLEAAARYIWTLSDGTGAGMGGGMGGGGMGGGMGGMGGGMGGAGMGGGGMGGGTAGGGMGGGMN